MGSSGAGKTTLLDILAFRKTFGRITGDITVNGVPVNKSLFPFISAYALQEDVFIGTMTAAETLGFAMRLRCPGESQATVNQRVTDLLADLALSHVRDSLVGADFTRGLSGGERKRLSIALQLIANPMILFLDEPTTGLVCVRA